MHIVVIHQYFLGPEDPGGSRFNELARFWQEAGHRVTVIAGQVAHGTGERPAKYAGRWLVREEEAGVTVLRAYTPESYSRGYAGRMLAFFAFAFSAATAAMGAVGRPDVLIATSPPLTTAVPGWLAARRWRAPLIFEVRDLWPESAVTMGVLRPEGQLTRVLYALERFIYSAADRISVLTPAFRDNIVERGLAAAEKIVFVPNGADLDLFAPGPRENEARERWGWGDRKVFLYAGAHGPANHLWQLIEAAEQLRGREDILIVTVGDGPERPALEAEVVRRSLGNFQMIGALPKREMPALVQACDAGLAVLKRVDTFKTVYPNKVFDYMACARPVVLAIDGVARRLVIDEGQAGLFAEPENAESLANAITRLADDAGLREALAANGRRYVVENFAREALAARYLGVLESMRAAPAATAP